MSLTARVDMLTNPDGLFDVARPTVDLLLRVRITMF